MRSVLRILLCYYFTTDLYKLRKYIWLVALDKDNIPCDQVYVDGVPNESESGFQCLVLVDSVWGNGSISVFLHVVHTCDSYLICMQTMWSKSSSGNINEDNIRRLIIE